MKTADIQKMTPDEKMRTIEALWDSLIHDDSEIKSPDWHGEILRERKRKIEHGEAEYISLEDLKKNRS